MANANRITNEVNFYYSKETPWLDNMHTVFGQVVEGLEVINTIEADDVIEKSPSLE